MPSRTAFLCWVMRERESDWAEERWRDLMALGGPIRRRLRPTGIPLVSPLFYLPEIDPVTMRSTGRVKTARLA